MLSDYYDVYKNSGLGLLEFSLLVLIFEENHDFIEDAYEKNFLEFENVVRTLEANGYVKCYGIKCTDVMLRRSGEQLFTHLKKKIKKKISKEEVEKWFDQWRSLFPEGVNSGGYRYRGNRLEGLKKMVTFVNLYPYTTEEIFEATKGYVYRFSFKGYAYMLLAHYFIEKKDVGSTLASECEALKERSPERKQEGYGGKVI